MPRLPASLTTVTSKVFRLAPAAECSSDTRFRSTPEHEFTVTGGGLEVKRWRGPHRCHPRRRKSTSQTRASSPFQFSQDPTPLALRWSIASDRPVSTKCFRLPDECPLHESWRRPEPAHHGAVQTDRNRRYLAGAEFSFVGRRHRTPNVLARPRSVDARAPGISRTGHRR